jgi:hypothetical protein
MFLRVHIPVLLVSTHVSFAPPLTQVLFLLVHTLVALFLLQMSDLRLFSLGGSSLKGLPTSLSAQFLLCSHLNNRRKIFKSMSFFPLMDSYGTIQLVVTRKTCQSDSDPLSELSDVPTESAVLIQGHVRLRPANSMRRVCKSDLRHISRFLLIVLM